MTIDTELMQSMYENLQGLPVYSVEVFDSLRFVVDKDISTFNESFALERLERLQAKGLHARITRQWAFFNGAYSKK